MKQKSAYIIVSLFVLFQNAFVDQGLATASTTLQRVIEAAQFRTEGVALSATFVRTQYVPQTIEASIENNDPEILRTSISELLVNDGGIKESVCNSRAIGGHVKQYAYHYSNNGVHSRTYDSRNNYATARKSSNAISNYLSLALSPYASGRRNRFISRTMPTFFPRLSSAKITLEADVVINGAKCITLEGEYESSIPERYFKITVIPDYNYAIAHLQEYDANKRILSEIKTDDFVNVSDLWIAKQSVAKLYKYDDYEGNTVQISKLEILDTKAVSVTEDDFVIKFPRDAKAHDLTLDMDLGIVNAKIEDVLSESLDDLADSEILKDKKGKKIVARAKQVYERENSNKPQRDMDNENIEGETSEAKNLQMPMSKSRGFRIDLIGILLGVTALLCCMVYVYGKLKYKRLIKSEN